MNNGAKYDIVSLVMNPVSRDARVLKQATSLHNAGYSIICIGSQTDDYQSLTDNFGEVIIHRPSLKLASDQSKSIQYLVLFVLFSCYYFFSPTPLVPLELTVLILAFLYLIWRILKDHIKMLNPILRLRRDSAEINKTTKVRRILNIIRFFVALQISLTRMIALFKAVVAIRPKVLHCHDVTTLPVGILYKMIFNVHLVYDAHEIYEDLANKDEKKSQLYKYLHSKVQRKLSKFITINNSIAKWYAENYPELPRASIIKNATMRVEQVDYDGRLHDAAGLDQNTSILLYQGGFAKHRGLEWLVRAGALLPEDWALVMMGWGNLESELRDLASKKNAVEENKVCFIPPAPQSELAYWTQGASLGIIPYDEVGLNHKFCTPNKLWEYPNASVPLVVSDLPEMKNTIDEFGIGWILPQNRSDSDLLNLVQSLQESDIQRRRDNCDIFMKEDGWHKYEMRLLKCYAELIPGDAADA